EGRRELQRDVVSAIDGMVHELAGIAGALPQSIYQITLAGNTTMQHLFAGLDPTALGEIPFVPAVSGPLRVSASQLGLNIHPRATAYVFPVIGGFVGGDTVAGL